MKITLSAARINAGFEQKEAAKALDITPETLRKYERLEASPTVWVAEKICALYNVKISNVIFLPSNIGLTDNSEGVKGGEGICGQQATSETRKALN